MTAHIVEVETAEEECGGQDVDRRSSRGEESVAEVECLNNRRNPHPPDSEAPCLVAGLGSVVHGI